jgi:RNA polymerase sigma factor (sigma-70 family)
LNRTRGLIQLAVVDDSELDDAPFVKAVASGDISALGVLYDRHYVAVRQFLRRVGLEEGEVDDVAQDVFLSLRACAGRFDGRSSARPLLLGIAARRSMRARDRIRRWARALLLSPSATPVARPDELLQRADEHRLFDAALGRISERKRVVFIMMEREGMSSREVADALGVPIGTVWTRLFHARAELVRRLARHDLVANGPKPTARGAAG